MKIKFRFLSIACVLAFVGCTGSGHVIRTGSPMPAQARNNYKDIGKIEFTASDKAQEKLQAYPNFKIEELLPYVKRELMAIDLYKPSAGKTPGKSLEIQVEDIEANWGIVLNILTGAAGATISVQNNQAVSRSFSSAEKKAMYGEIERNMHKNNHLKGEIPTSAVTCNTTVINIILRDTNGTVMHRFGLLASCRLPPWMGNENAVRVWLFKKLAKNISEELNSH